MSYLEHMRQQLAEAKQRAEGARRELARVERQTNDLEDRFRLERKRLGEDAARRRTELHSAESAVAGAAADLDVAERHARETTRSDPDLLPRFGPGYPYPTRGEIRRERR
jgi:hypothetical protein